MQGAELSYGVNMNLREGTRRLALLLGVAGAILGAFALALMVSGCRKKPPLPSPGQSQTEPKAESHPWPCIDRPRSNPGADAAMFQRVSGQGIWPDIQHIPYEYVELAQKMQPAVITLMDFYGDPHDPDIPSMMDYAKLADDPHAQKTLGEAFAYLNQKDEVATADVERTMTESERLYFETATMTLDNIDSSNANVDRLRVPLIGTVATSNSRSYLNQMLLESEQLRVSLNGMPDNRRALWWLEYRTSQMIDKLNVGCAK
jgi:hypothetical protein